MASRTHTPPTPTSPTVTPLAPLWDGYCADPFVLRGEDGRFVMYGTAPGLRPDGRAFQTLVSDDLQHWEPVGGALVIPDDTPPDAEWWAPEVAYAEGRYWMYYSRGLGERGHQLWVAVSDTATGPFVDAAGPLTPQLPFAIDPSPFQDADGSWWLFYATDLVEGERPGTVLGVQRLRTMTELTGAPQVILRASADWQLYLRDRPMYGARHDWHTLEGPAVMRDGDRYWLLYSGGNWQTPGYGVAVATATSVQGPWREDVGEGPFITSASVGLVGPGHCSVLPAEDGRQHLFLHAWDEHGERRRPYRFTLDVTADHPEVTT